MWVVFDSCALLDLIEQNESTRNKLVGRLKNSWASCAREGTQNEPIRLWFPPITIGEVALLQFPSYRTSRWRGRNQIADETLRNQVNVAFEAIGLLDPAMPLNLQRRLPGLDFELVISEPGHTVSRLALHYFADHRKSPAYLHCEFGRVKSIGDTADQLAFEYALAVAQSTKTTTVFLTSDFGLLATLQGLGVDRHRVELVNSKNPLQQLQGPNAELMKLQCPGNVEICQGVRRGTRIPCERWPRSITLE